MAHVVVPIAALDTSAHKALAHARTLGRARTPIMAVHVAADRASAAQLRRDWEASAPDAELVILEAARDRHPSPLLAYLDLLRACAADELTVVLPDSDVAEALHDRPGIVVVEAVPMEQAN